MPEWPFVIFVLFTVIALGRVFCAWVCPAVLLRRVFGDMGGSTAKLPFRNFTAVSEFRRLLRPAAAAVKPDHGNWMAVSSRGIEGYRRLLRHDGTSLMRRKHRANDVPRDAAVKVDNGAAQSEQVVAPMGINWAAYSPYAVLGGVLLASFIFRFPVFCFFCPIGLFFGALYAVFRLLSPDPLSVELVLFPAMLALELWVLKSWCRTICPLGALLSIVGSFNRFLRPVVNKDKCLVAKGVNCQACRRVCPEGIDLTRKRRILSANSCTKCLACSDRCPAKAIKFPLHA
ncbi:MAG: 4Fe-4S binding protein [Chloroflexi bacterium]|nr:4Fe-4S binding protein [Chloroflexota bacterium]